MPLRDHFRPPLSRLQTWDGLHAMWPAVIVQHLIKILPARYFALPGVHLGNQYEIDIGTFSKTEYQGFDSDADEGGVAVATYAPPKPTRTMEAELDNQDVYEVRIYDDKPERVLVAAIEIVSPSNKDRPDHRMKLIAKMAQLLETGVCVSVIDLVSDKDYNLYAELLETLHTSDSDVGEEPSPMYAATMRMRLDNNRGVLDSWYHPLSLGQLLPTLPVFLRNDFAVSLELEATYEETCRTLRIR